MEVLGGNGYVEESALPRLYREMPVNSIWEGSGNVMALDVVRATRRELRVVALGSDAVLLSVDQGGHTAYLTTASTCTNDTTTAFLTRGVLPSGPRLCPGQPLPA